MFHNFPDETDIGEGYLVRSLDLQYIDMTENGGEDASGVHVFPVSPLLHREGI